MTATNPAPDVAPGSPSATRLRLDVRYDGTDFAGWATQPERRTVAGVLVEALDRLFGAGCVTGLTVAGRTDSGVHATGQVCHLDVPTAVWQPLASTAVRRLAGLLPDDVRVVAATEVPASFDARFSALSRRYAYRVCDAPSGVDPLQRGWTLTWPRPLDVSRLNEAAAPLCGEHDFAAYCRRKENGTTVRALQRVDWVRDGEVVVATVEADAFCQAMVRSLVGALLVVGDGRRPVGWPAELLTRRARASEVNVVPPHGLTLVAVRYPETVEELGSRALLTRQMRG